MHRIESKIIEKLKERDLNVNDLFQERVNKRKKSKVNYSELIRVGKQLDEKLIEIGDVPDTVNDLTNEEILNMLKRNREISKAYVQYGETVKEILKK